MSSSEAVIKNVDLPVSGFGRAARRERRQIRQAARLAEYITKMAEQGHLDQTLEPRAGRWHIGKQILDPAIYDQANVLLAPSGRSVDYQDWLSPGIPHVQVLTIHEISAETTQ